MKQIVCWGRVIMAITMIFCDVEVSAYKVYPSSGHKCKDQLLNIDSYTYVRKHADGIWMMPWNIRTGYISDEELKIILDGFENKSMVAEINDSHVKWDSEYPEAKQLTKVLKAGAEINTIMAYNEHMNGSVLTQKNIDNFKRVYGENYKIVSNVRRWSPELASTLILLDGLSFEFQIPERFDGVWDQVIKAAQWALENDKEVYLLSPCGHDSYHLNNGYLTAYQTFFKLLRNALGDEDMKSDKLIFAPANYDKGKTNLNMTPETIMVDGVEQNANTVMGVAKWLLQHPLYQP